MDIYLKAIAAALITVIFCLVLSKRDKDMALLLTAAVCCMVAAAAVGFLSPVLAFLRNLQTLGQLDPRMFEILLKSVGIGLLAEITSLLCADAGNAALGKSIQLLSAAVILWMAIPLLQGLLDILQSVLGEL